MTITVTLGDCVEVLRNREGPLFDSCVCDPPYGLSSEPDVVEVLTHWLAGDDYIHKGNGFMGRSWDSFVPGPSVWREVYRNLKPGAALVAFFGTRTYDLGVLAIRMAGFEIRDQLAWAYGSGFPKSLDVSKAIDKAAGAARQVTGPRMRPDGKSQLSARKGGESRGEAWDRPWREDREAVARNGMDTAPATAEAEQWQGWGTALKPAWEPICLARKPLDQSTVAANVLAHGTGGLNIDACRIETGDDLNGGAYSGEIRNRDERTSTDSAPDAVAMSRLNRGLGEYVAPAGRFPANLIHDGSEEVLAAFPDSGGKGGHVVSRTAPKFQGVFSPYDGAAAAQFNGYDDEGSAARFFYSAKAGPLDRLGTDHSTVKPVDVMRWLERLVTRPGGLILDPFAGSGTTGIAAMAEGFDCELIDLIPEHVEDIERKLALMRGEGAMIMERHVKRKAARSKRAPSPLFGDDA